MASPYPGKGLLVPTLGSSPPPNPPELPPELPVGGRRCPLPAQPRHPSCHPAPLPRRRPQYRSEQAPRTPALATCLSANSLLENECPPRPPSPSLSLHPSHHRRPAPLVFICDPPRFFFFRPVRPPPLPPPPPLDSPLPTLASVGSPRSHGLAMRAAPIKRPPEKDLEGDRALPLNGGPLPPPPPPRPPPPLPPPPRPPVLPWPGRCDAVGVVEGGMNVGKRLFTRTNPVLPRPGSVDGSCRGCGGCARCCRCCSRCRCGCR